MPGPELSWYASTKLRAPARRHDALLRPRLLQAIESSLAYARIALISAPAGAGKTTLLAELPHGVPGQRWAWLLLDEEDNDPSRFIAGAVASLQQIDPGIGAGAVAGSPLEPPAWQQAITAIINGVSQSPGDPIVLVIDDFHLITEETVLTAVNYLIDWLPLNMRVVIGSRHDPPLALSRWLARGILVELRMGDLSFTEPETAELINTCLALAVDPETVRQLYVRTEGWAAGLRLLATSLAQTPSGRQVWPDNGMRGRQRIFEFLSEEVLDRQHPELRQFLLETSILSSLSGPACDALTGRSDSQPLLERLYRQNLYVAAADEAGLNYRYHDLFADFLRDRLQRERPADWRRLHERAAGIEPEPNRRIRHWIIAENWERASEEIQILGPDYVRQGFSFTLRRWILEIPEAVRRAYPRLALLLGTSIWVRSELAQAQAYFHEALAGFRQKGDLPGQGESLMALSITANMFSQPERAQLLFQEALRFPLPAASRLEFHAAAGWDALNRRAWPEVHRHLNEVLDLLSEPNVASNAFGVALMIYGTSFPDFLDRLDGALPRLHEHLADGTEFNQANYLALRAATLQFRGDLAGSRREAEAVLAIGERTELPLIVRLSAMVTLLMDAFSEGEWSRAEAFAKALVAEHALTPFLQRWKPLATYFQGRTRWLAGDCAGVKAAYERIATPEPEESPQPHVNRLLLAGMLRICERSYAQAQKTFEEALRLQEEFRITAGSSSAAVLLAYVHWKRGQAEEALHYFAPYLEEAGRLNGPGYIMRENPIVIPLLRLAYGQGLHREFTGRCLDLLGAPLHAEEETGGEPLSEREREVLHVMAEGLSNRAIGEKLFVSEATVKTHVQRILRKLDVSSRTQAIARARELMML
jgi:LuxR family maltose regulon positive regulatory protein